MRVEFPEGGGTAEWPFWRDQMWRKTQSYVVWKRLNLRQNGTLEGLPSVLSLYNMQTKSEVMFY